jgi:hypothetical protein
MPSSQNEANIILALQALQKNPKLSMRRAADIYHIKWTTLRNRKNGIQPRCNSIANLRKVSDLEEQTIVQYIIDLNTRGFSPRLCDVEYMASRLLAE